MVFCAPLTIIRMYPDWQFWFWWRSVFVKKGDFVYRDETTGAEVSPGERMRWVRRITMAVVKRDWMIDVVSNGFKRFGTGHLLRGLKV
jgi:hypothetical protein